MAQHKWHKEIKAWADGEEIEWRFNSTTHVGYWEDVLSENPSWHDPRTEYRIKPQPKPDVYLYVYFNANMVSVYEKKIDGWDEVFLGKIKLETENE